MVNTEPNFRYFRYLKYRRRYRCRYLKISDIGSVFRYTDSPLGQISIFNGKSHVEKQTYMTWELCHRYQRMCIFQFNNFYTAIIWIYSATFTEILCKFDHFSRRFGCSLFKHFVDVCGCGGPLATVHVVTRPSVFSHHYCVYCTSMHTQITTKIVYITGLAVLQEM